MWSVILGEVQQVPRQQVEQGLSGSVRVVQVCAFRCQVLYDIAKQYKDTGRQQAMYR